MTDSRDPEADNYAGMDFETWAVCQAFGMHGRQITAAKHRYVAQHRRHVPVFNANICLAERKLWWGDLDLTIDEPGLVALAVRLGQTIFVLPERAARFKNEAHPLFDEKVYSVTATGETTFAAHIVRDSGGLLRPRTANGDPPPSTSADSQAG